MLAAQEAAGEGTGARRAGGEQLLADVLADKYDFARAEAQALADFILPMLDFDPSKRATAAQMLAHPWLSEAAPALDEGD